MSRTIEKATDISKASDGVDVESVFFFTESFQAMPGTIREGQCVSYVVQTDASGRQYATDIRFEDETGIDLAD